MALKIGSFRSYHDSIQICDFYYKNQTFVQSKRGHDWKAGMEPADVSVPEYSIAILSS